MNALVSYETRDAADGQGEGGIGHGGIQSFELFRTIIYYRFVDSSTIFEP